MICSKPMGLPVAIIQLTAFFVLTECSQFRAVRARMTQIQRHFSGRGFISSELLFFSTIMNPYHSPSPYTLLGSNTLDLELWLAVAFLPSPLSIKEFGDNNTPRDWSVWIENWNKTRCYTCNKACESWKDIFFHPLIFLSCCSKLVC